MKREQKVWLISAALVLAALGIILGPHPVVRWNTSRLKAAVRATEEDVVTLNQVVPFGWDAVYTFAPYDSKEEIEDIIGFSSSAVQENWISEGMVHLLFVKDQTVVASVLGYADKLGYDIVFSNKVTREEKAPFRVERKGDITRLVLDAGATAGDAA